MRRRWLTAGLFAALLLALARQGTAAPESDTTPPWPRTLSRNGASVTIYQPQAESWPNRQRLTARAAVALTPQGAAKPLLGTIELSLATNTDADAGIVDLSDPKLIATHFPALDTQQAAKLEAKLQDALPSLEPRPVPLAAVLLSLQQGEAAPAPVNNDPPAIFYASGPASLVVFDGEPAMAPAGGAGVQAAVNTNWHVLGYQGKWYLLANGRWFAAEAATGPYKPAAQVPAALGSVPKDAVFADVHANLPARAAAPGTAAPAIFVSTKPAEIIVTEGKPDLQAVQGTGLQRVANTASTLFFYASEKKFYVLLSGRWFAASDLAGPWIYATPTLPGDFAMISADGPAAPVLASVPDTPQAQEAVLKSQIPTTATLKRGAAKPTIVYAGSPHFVPVPGTKIEYAANTASVVLRIEGKYFACVNGAWFTAAAPTGPWTLADSLPAAIRTIPPSSPLYPVTYVQIYGATPQAVTYGYTAGYMMGFVSAGVLVYGTGYYYPPYIVRGPVPIYYPYPCSYVGPVYYNSATGAWARGGTIYGPYGAASGARYYNPSTGAWAQGGAIYGPNGGIGGFSAYNPSTGSWAHGSASWGNGYGTANASGYNANTGRSASTNQNWNPYGRWGSSTFSGPNQTVNTQSRGNANGAAGSFNSSTGAQGAGYHNRATGNSGGVVKTANGDVYAGRDGNVYKHTDSGWQKYTGGAWNPVQKPASPTNRTSKKTAGTSNPSHGTYQQLEQDRVGRQSGWRQNNAGGTAGGYSNRGGGFRGRRGG